MSSAEWLPSVSVVVPVFNGARTIEACVDSLLASDYPRERFEVVIVDNDSTDDTARRLSAYGERIRVGRRGRRGPAAARNHGVRMSGFDLIAFTDADCEVDRRWLRSLVRVLEDETVGIAGGRILALHPANPIESYGERIHDHRRALEDLSIPYAITMNWASRRSTLEDLGLFDESLLRGEDSDLSLRIFASGRRLVYCSEAVVRHWNRSTLRALFRESCQHGFYSVAVRKRNRPLLAKKGVRRLYPSTYRRLLSDWGAVLAGDRGERLYSGLFGLGSKLGKLAGSVRFGELSL